MKTQFTKAADGYLEKRQLRRHARTWHLWAMGVGAVISGDFFGWNFGMATGGFGGMVLAVAVMTVMYVGLCFSIAEMSAALPHAGGAYSFARHAFGPLGGYITGLAENMEYILTPAVIVVGAGGYLGSFLGVPAAWEPALWVLLYVLFVAFNVWGVEMSFHVSVFVTLVALAVLVLFWVGAAHLFNLGRWATPYFPAHVGKVSATWAELPYALWLYLGIEQLPLAAEESHDPARDMPRGIMLGLLTLVGVSFLTVIFSAGIAPGVAKLATSNEPLMDDFRTIFGGGVATRVLALLACTGLIASFHTIIFAYGRQIFSLSRSGYFPTWLSETHGYRRTPQRALIAGSVLGLVVVVAIKLTPQGGAVGAVLLNMAVFGAVLAYVLQMASYIALRLRFPLIERPYKSPLGIAGAVIAAAIAIATLVTLFLSADYNKGVIGAAVWFILGIAYYVIYARQRLILAPEEASAAAHEKERGA